MATTEQFSELISSERDQPDLMPQAEARGYVRAIAIAAVLWSGIAAGSVYFLF